MSQEYTNYIVEHKSNVQKAHQWLLDHIMDVVDQEFPPVNILMHDLSKYQPEEYDAYDNYFYGKKTDKVKEDFDYAWLHHIHNNPHHWQHWVLVNDDDGTKALEMPVPYVFEMIADWWSFSWKKGNLYEIFEWYDSHKKNMILHKNTKKLVEDILAKIKKVLDVEADNE